MRPVLSGCVAAAAIICASCSDVVQSHLVTDGATPAGLVYSLPKGQVLINATRTVITQADVVAAQAKLDQANNAVTKDNAAVAAAGTDATKLAAAQATLGADQATAKAAQNALTVAKNNVGKYQESATFSLLPIVPDVTAQYVVDVNHEPTRDDNVTFTVVNGLLTTTSLTSTDQTPNIIITLADTVITAAQVVAPAPAAPTVAKARQETPDSCPYSIAEVFDPLNSDEVENVATRLKQKGASVSLKAPSVLQRVAVPAQQRNPQTEVSGMVYRVATPAILQLLPSEDPAVGTRCPLASPIAAQSVSTIVPDTRTRFVVSSKAGAFTTTTLGFGFSNGMLTSYTAQRPSEVAAVAGIPIRILNDVMTIPASILKLRIDLDNQKTALVNAESNLKAAQIQQSTTITNALTAVTNAQTALSQAQYNQPTAIANAQVALIQAQLALQKAKQAAATAVATPTSSTP